MAIRYSGSGSSKVWVRRVTRLGVIINTDLIIWKSNLRVMAKFITSSPRISSDRQMTCFTNFTIRLGWTSCVSWKLTLIMIPNLRNFCICYRFMRVSHCRFQKWWFLTSALTSQNILNFSGLCRRWAMRRRLLRVRSVIRISITACCLVVQGLMYQQLRSQTCPQS